MLAPMRPRPTIPSSMAVTLRDAGPDGWPRGQRVAWRTEWPSTDAKHADADADVLTIFGISGDLAKKMTFRALYRLEARGKLDCPIVGVAIDDWDDEQLRRARPRRDRRDRQRPRRGRLRPPRRPPLLRPGRLRRRRHLRAGRAALGDAQAAGLLPRDPALALRHRRPRARRGRPDRERPRRDREALRPRPRVGAGAQRRTLRGARRGPDPAHRPLPRQGAGDGHHLPALRQLDPGAGLEPRARLPRADDDRRGLRRRRPRPLLRRGRGDARRDPEPRPAGAGAGRRWGRRPATTTTRSATRSSNSSRRCGPPTRSATCAASTRASSTSRTWRRTRPPRPSPRSSWRSTTGAGAASPSSSAPASACRPRRAR